MNPAKEAWRQCARAALPDALLEQIELDAVRVNELAGRITIRLLSRAPLNDNQRDALTHALAEPLRNAAAGELAVELSVREILQPTPPKPQSVARKPQNTKASASAPAGKPIVGRMTQKAPVGIATIDERDGRVKVVGRVFQHDVRETRDGKKIILLFALTDEQDSISCKRLMDKQSAEARKAVEAVKTGKRLIVEGSAYADRFSGNELVIDVSGIAEAPPAPQRVDDAEHKRVELHLHTQMSTLDSTLSVADAVQTAARWGQTAIAVTDHGVVQSFPDFYSEAKKAGIKAIFGMEGYLHDDCECLPIETARDQTFVVFDIETTGLREKTDQITEIGAVKLQNGAIVDRFSTFVNPCCPIPAEIVALTGITDDMVADAPMPDEAIRNFVAFCADATLVAHNATNFDMRFITEHAARYDIAFEMPHIDTLFMARSLLPDLERHSLDALTAHFAVSLDNHHRADCDAEATAQVFLALWGLCEARGVGYLPVVTDAHRRRTSKEKNRNHHIVLLVENEAGLKNLYQLVTYSHLKHFSRRPRIPRSLLMMHREGLVLGSACESGELFRAMVAGQDDAALERIALFYDYLEIQPIGNNAFLVREGVAEDDEALRNFNRRIVALAERLGMPCAATTDAHFLEPRDEVFRRILLDSQKFSDADNQPPIYMRTTGEMLAEFDYLGADKAFEAVVTAPNAIADRCKMLRPFPAETCQPSIPGAEEELVESCEAVVRAIYGDSPPAIVRQRMDHELKAITQYGFSSLYVTACRLVKKSNEDGYLVGSRGSVGSSLVAFLSGITEVNALPPHYVCPSCKHADFDVDTSTYACGCDLPDRCCPVCGAQLAKDGYNIPFETFLGFEGDKVPDIDLNFSGDYQPVAHKYTEVLFGAGNVFRAGTISGIQQKTAYGYVMKYFEAREKTPRRAEIERVAAGCCGVKRTTGQHPGGIVVVPSDRDVHDFTPLQHPADKDSAGSVTTHFDFASMHDTLVKLDILGHDDPTVIRMLQDLTGIDPKTIPLDDPDTMRIFSSVETLGVDPGELGSEVGTYGVPEFGTNFVRRMLVDTRPTTMEELVRISGLSHGTDVWTNNAQDLVKAGTVTLSQAICTRDDIMTYLIRCGMDKKESFNIMERVRKGKGLAPEMESSMRASSVPAWYIDSCKKIKYMFPRAHAAAYVMMAFRIAYCKVHHPMAYYAAYFTVRADAFDIAEASGTIPAIKRRIHQLAALGLKASDKEKSLQTVLEVVLEMKLRGFDFAPIDIMASDASKFQIVGDSTLLPPLDTIAGLGAKAAESIVAARADGPFQTHEDLQKRAKVGKATTDTLAAVGCLNGIPESAQMSLFDGLADGVL